MTSRRLVVRQRGDAHGAVQVPRDQLRGRNTFRLRRSAIKHGSLDNRGRQAGLLSKAVDYEPGAALGASKDLLSVQKQENGWPGIVENAYGEPIKEGPVHAGGAIVGHHDFATFSRRKRCGEKVKICLSTRVGR